MSKVVLFIVEGERREVEIINSMKCFLPEDTKIVSACVNIHMLYRIMKEYDFEADITTVLQKMDSVSESDKEMLRSLDRVTYTYLIFDFDVQYYKLLSEDNLESGFNTIYDMLLYFNNETDGTIGKMYINYPMVEAFRDCTDFFDNGYKDRVVELDELTGYKEIVGKRGISTNISRWNYDDYLKLIDMNLYKANYLVNRRWIRPSYNEYIESIGQINIMNSEKDSVIIDRQVSVLCCMYLVIVDYIGKRLWNMMQ